jgi:hypothetical protein
MGEKIKQAVETCVVVTDVVSRHRNLLQTRTAP